MIRPSMIASTVQARACVDREGCDSLHPRHSSSAFPLMHLAARGGIRFCHLRMSRCKVLFFFVFFFNERGTRRYITICIYDQKKNAYVDTNMQENCIAIPGMHSHSADFALHGSLSLVLCSVYLHPARLTDSMGSHLVCMWCVGPWASRVNCQR